MIPNFAATGSVGRTVRHRLSAAWKGDYQTDPHFWPCGDGKRGTRPGRYSMNIDVRRGNSGGPVLDRAGRVIGVVVAKVNTPGVYAATGRLVQNVGIAIRLSVALDFLRKDDVAIRELSTTSPLTEAELFSKAHQFVGQVGCWR